MHPRKEKDKSVKSLCCQAKILRTLSSVGGSTISTTVMTCSECGRWLNTYTIHEFRPSASMDKIELDIF